MPEPNKPHPRRRRRWPFVLLALALLGGAAAWALRHYTQPRQLTALLIGQTRNLLGADLSLGGQARYGFWPKLHVILPQPALRAPGATGAFLRADALEAVLPWRTLWADRYEIERIDLVRPTLDLDAFSTWLAARPPSNSAAPDVRFALHVDDATLIAGGQPVAQGVMLDFASRGDLAAWLAQLGPHTTPLLPPLAGSAKASSLRIGDTRLEGVRIELRDDAVQPPSPP